jgi:hypothetical protein
MAWKMGLYNPFRVLVYGVMGKRPDSQPINGRIPTMEIRMNIKRAFIAATAALVLPGLAMAQTSFPTSIDFTNGNDGTVNVELTCNSGNPLVQDFDISEAGGVTFIVNGLVDGSNCSVALSGLDTGYEITSLPCDFAGITATGGPYACDMVAEPMSSTFTIVKEWVGAGADISTMADVKWRCTNASWDTGDEFGTIYDTETFYGDDDFDVVFYPGPGETSVCSADEQVDSMDSAAEGDEGCADGIDFVVGTEEGSCTITNTVFYEGIPTLSQYGLAILVLLTLGVGFVGVRRFV